MNDSGSQQGQMITLTVSKGIGSRTEMGDIDPKTQKRLIHWNADMADDGKARERIYVGSSQNPSISGILYLNPSSLEGDPTTGTFTGYVFGDPSKLDYSVYPVPEGGIIDLTKRIGKYVDAPMVGEIKGGNVQFENTCAIREVNIPGITGQDFELSANAGNEALKLGATAVVKFDANDKPYLEFTSTGNVVKVNNVPNDVFYVPFEITKNTKANVTFSGKASNQTTPIDITEVMDLSSAKPGILAESGAKELHCVNGEIVQPTPKAADDFVSKTPTTSEGEEKEDVPTYTMGNEEKSTNLQTIPSSTNVAVEIVAPEEAGTSTPNEKVLSIGQVPEAVDNLIFTDTQAENIPDDNPDDDDPDGDEPEQPTPKEAKQKVTIALPETAAGKVIDFNMPNSTVNVQSKSGEELSINKVTASTADNTFIIGSGVSIKELVAMKGSIEVSGEVEDIKKGNGNHYGNDKVKVKVKKGGKISGNIDKNNFEVEYEDGDVPPVVEPEEPEILEEYRATNVLGFEAFKEALNKNARYTYIELGDGMAIEEPIVIEEDRRVEINLNGQFMVLINEFFERYNPEAVIDNSGDLIIYNGTIQGHSIEEGSLVDNYLLKSGNMMLQLRGVNIQTRDIKNAIYIRDGKLRLENSQINAAGNALYLEANSFCDTYIDQTTIYGHVNLALNSPSFTKTCSLAVAPGCTINGDLIYGGKYGNEVSGFEVSKATDSVTNGKNWPGGNTGGNKEETRNVSDFDDLKSALELNNVNIKIEESFDLTAPLKIRQNQKVVMNLQGKTLSVNLPDGYVNPEGLGSGGGFITNNGNLTILNGTLNGQTVSTGEFVRFFHSVNADSFFLYGVHINNNKFRWCITLSGTKQGEIDNFEGDVPTIIEASGADAALELRDCAMTVLNVVLKGNVIVGDGANLSVNAGRIEGELEGASDNNTVNVSTSVTIIDETGSWGTIGGDNNGGSGETPDEGDEGDEETGTAVASFQELQGALDNPEVTNILLTAPITITTNSYLELRIGNKTIVVDDTVWDVADAAITITTSEQTDYNNYFNVNFNGVDDPENRGVITGSTTQTGKHLIKSTSVGVGLNGITMQVGDALNAIYVENAPCYLSLYSMITSAEGDAIDIKANPTTVEANVNGGSQVNGIVRFLLHNFHAEHDYEKNSIIVDNGSVKTVVVEGQPVDVLNVNYENGGTIESIKQGGSGVNVSPFYKQEWE